MKLETGQITEAEFDAQEKVLLDRLDRIQRKSGCGSAARRPSRSKAKSSQEKSFARGETGNPRLTDAGRPNAGKINPSAQGDGM